jgi:hypothetical protein
LYAAAQAQDKEELSRLLVAMQLELLLVITLQMSRGYCFQRPAMPVFSYGRRRVHSNSRQKYGRLMHASTAAAFYDVSSKDEPSTISGVPYFPIYYNGQ